MDRSWVVLKFGGTTLATRERWEMLVSVAEARRNRGAGVLLVVSALRGVAADLEQLVPASIRGHHVPVIERVAARHAELGRQLGVDAEVELALELAELGRHALAITLLGEATPKLRAKVAALGERMLTRLALPFLQQHLPGLTAIDARELLVTEPGADYRHFLSGVVHARPDPGLAARLGLSPYVLTQADTAADPAGETVRLGRGGGDLSATVLAARLGAHHLELWSDAPGLSTADPRFVDQARSIAAVDPAVAAELAALGARVMHPRAFGPAREAGLLVEARSVLAPESPGTRIAADAEADPGVTALVVRPGLTVIQVDNPDLGSRVGFLGDVLEVFREHAVSVALVGTTSTNLSLAVDLAANQLDTDVLELLKRDLAPLGEVRFLAPCAAVALVGHGVSAALATLEVVAPPVHLLTHGAADTTLSLVVDEGSAGKLLRALHTRLFEGGRAAPVAEAPVGGWWVERRGELLAAGAGVHRDLPLVDARLARFRALPVDEVWFPEARDPVVADHLHAAGIGLRGVSDRCRLFDARAASAATVAAAHGRGATVLVGNPWVFQAWPELWGGREVHLHLDVGPRTRAPSGIPVDQLPLTRERADAVGARITGLHAHPGRSLLAPGTWADVADALAPLRGIFPEVGVLGLGGGFAETVDLDAVAESLSAWRRLLPDTRLWIEPGRALFGPAILTLAPVVQVAERQGRRRLVVAADGVAPGRVWVNLSRWGEPAVAVVDVVDAEGAVVAAGLTLPATEAGDLLALLGAAGRVDQGLQATTSTR